MRVITGQSRLHKHFEVFSLFQCIESEQKREKKKKKKAVHISEVQLMTIGGKKRKKKCDMQAYC